MKATINYPLSVLYFFLIKEIFEILYIISIIVIYSKQWDDYYPLLLLFTLSFILCFILHILLYKKVFFYQFKYKVWIIVFFSLSILLIYLTKDNLVNYTLSLTDNTEKILGSFGVGNVFSVVLQILIIAYYLLGSFRNRNIT